METQFAVWKYPVPSDRVYFSLEMPVTAKILTLALQHGEPYFWALVEPSRPKVRREFFLRGTGHAFMVDVNKYEMTHIGSFLVENDTFVFHLFELIRM